MSSPKVASHPTFAFLLDAWAYMRLHRLRGWRPEKVSFKEWRLVKDTQ